jgi:hypothetical protein
MYRPRSHSSAHRCLLLNMIKEAHLQVDSGTELQFNNYSVNTQSVLKVLGLDAQQPSKIM